MRRLRHGGLALRSRGCVRGTALVLRRHFSPRGEPASWSHGPGDRWQRPTRQKASYGTPVRVGSHGAYNGIVCAPARHCAGATFKPVPEKIDLCGCPDARSLLEDSWASVSQQAKAWHIPRCLPASAGAFSSTMLFHARAKFTFLPLQEEASVGNLSSAWCWT